MQRQSIAQLVSAGVLVVTATAYLSIHLSDLRSAVLGLKDSLDPTTTTVINKKDPDMPTKTLTLSKIVNGTTVSIDFEWDCSAEDLRRIYELWKVICENPPPG